MSKYVEFKRDEICEVLEKSKIDIDIKIKSTEEFIRVLNTDIERAKKGLEGLRDTKSKIEKMINKGRVKTNETDSV